VADTINGPNYTTLIKLNIPKKGLSGLVTFKFELDSSNQIDELMPMGEYNNTFTYQYLFKQESPYFIYPQQNAIVSTNNPELIIQLPSYDNLTKELIIEWDSTGNFQDIIGKTTIQTTNNVVYTKILLPIVNNQDYFIRCKVSQEGSVSDWSNLTFGVIDKEPAGWTEGFYSKFDKTNNDYVYMDSSSRTLAFSKILSKDYRVYTEGDYRGIYRFRRIFINGQQVTFEYYPPYGVNFMIINPIDESRYIIPNSQFNVPFSDRINPNNPLTEYNVVGEPCGVYNFNTDIPANQDSLIKFLDDVPVGFHIIMLNAYACDPTIWKEELWNAFSKFGIILIKQVKKGDPFVVFGTKKSIPESAIEILPDFDDDITPTIRQTMNVTNNFPANASEGFIYSDIIGPALSWERFKINFEHFNKSNDSFNISILASKDLKQWNEVIKQNGDSTFSLNQIDAKLYPYLRIKVYLNDIVKRTPPNVTRWRVNYVHPSEGIIDFDNGYFFSKDTLQEGENINLKVAFKNILEHDFDSTNYIIYRKKNNHSDTLTNKGMTSIKRNNSFAVNDTFTTTGLNGDYDLYISFNPDRDVMEGSYDNNIHKIPFHVLRDSKNPLLDVVFDGYHILDYDIVSPNTEIKVSLSDENSYLMLSDPNVFDIKLVKPNLVIDTINTSLINVSFVPSTEQGSKAMLIYKADDLAEGDYQLKVNAKDASGNQASPHENTVNFRVVKETSISNIYPYPNPFTTSTRFVFTLTGTQVPDYLKIQIMTVSGKVVREITKEDLGAIKIGNNISEYAWNGTDEFGEMLANGVYLYKVIAKNQGENIAKFSDEDGSQFFNQGIGKIYLMR
jgi:hypothetical protein